MSMRMAVKTIDDKVPKIEAPEGHGRLKSDITNGKEKIYVSTDSHYAEKAILTFCVMNPNLV